MYSTCTCIYVCIDSLHVVLIVLNQGFECGGQLLRFWNNFTVLLSLVLLSVSIWTRSQSRNSCSSSTAWCKPTSTSSNSEFNSRSVEVKVKCCYDDVIVTTFWRSSCRNQQAITQYSFDLWIVSIVAFKPWTTCSLTSTSLGSMTSLWYHVSSVGTCTPYHDLSVCVQGWNWNRVEGGKRSGSTLLGIPQAFTVRW